MHIGPVVIDQRLVEVLYEKHAMAGVDLQESAPLSPALQRWTWTHRPPSISTFLREELLSILLSEESLPSSFLQ